MGLYTVSRSNLALPASTDDLLTIIPASTRQFEMLEASIGGMGTASAAGELQVARSTGGTTPGGAVNIEPWRESQAVAGFTNATTWSTQPTLGDVLVRMPINANGGLYRWVRIPGKTMIFSDDDTDKNLSFRPATGTPTITFHTVLEEF